MTGLDLVGIALPLYKFIERIGLQLSDFYKVETPEVISLKAQVPRSTLQCKDLTPSDFNVLKEVYGAALTKLTFAAKDEGGELPALRIDEQIDDARLKQFCEDISAYDDDPYLSVVLKKNELVQQKLPGLPAFCRVLLYFFPEALNNLLSKRFDALEADLWPTPTPCKTILLLPDLDIYLDGVYLSLVGGKHLASLSTIIPASQPDGERTRQMFEYCRKNLLWQDNWVKNITPLHFEIKASHPGDSVFPRILEIHLAGLTVLYTAHLTIETRKQLVSTYMSAQYQANVIIPTVDEALQKDLPQNSVYLLDLVNSVYDPVWLDRGRGLLPIVQSVVSDRLQAAPAEDAFEVFVRSAKSLVSAVELQWQSVFHNNLAAYFAEVKTLEEHITSTVSSTSQQIADMIKGLSDTMLAAVATIIGILFASLFTDKFNLVVRQGVFDKQVWIGYNQTTDCSTSIDWRYRSNA